MPSTAQQIAPGKPGSITVYEDTSWERMWASETSRLITYARPWLAAALLWPAAWISHQLWGRMPVIPWAMSALMLAAVGLAVFAYGISRLQPIGRAHTSATVALALTWLAVATDTGPSQQVTGGMLGIIGGTIAVSWNLRSSARASIHAAHNAGQDPAGRLSAWFKDAADRAGMPGAKMTAPEIGPAKATARVILPPGKTAADLIARTAAIESAGKVPPASITAAADPDQADHALLTLSDPRIFTKPIPWPGPSAPGTSIANPLCPGIFQDGEPVLYVIVGHHIYEMGASGSGKGMGGAWNLLGEIITRPDAVVVGADITKGEQTFGPLRPALHRFETDAKGARSLVDDVTSILKPRTDYLAERGLQKWQEGCGLSYLVAWYEETGRIWEKLSDRGEQNLIEAALALRSAGGTLVFSVQRNTYDQVPTIIRSQMASMCFGLNDPNDCRFGLSDRQQELGVNPAEWGIRTPGKAVLDAPTIPESRIAMPMRTFHWGENAELMTAHAAAYPAAARPPDPITAQICGGTTMPAITPAPGLARDTVTLTRPADPDDDGQADEHDNDDTDPCAEYLTGEDPSPDITALAVDPDAPIQASPDDEPFEFDQPEKMSPEDAREAFAGQLAAWTAEGRETFTPRDLRDLMTRTGMSRAWVQARLKEACEADNAPIERDDNAGTYRLRATPPNRFSDPV
jgi:hypothetical protein